jgi:hypothetical protein
MRAGGDKDSTGITNGCPNDLRDQVAFRVVRVVE